jgi:hypothetical protein
MQRVLTRSLALRRHPTASDFHFRVRAYCHASANEGGDYTLALGVY